MIELTDKVFKNERLNRLKEFKKRNLENRKEGFKICGDLNSYRYSYKRLSRGHRLP